MASKEIERGKGTRGRGAEGKQNVAVMAESTPLEDIETGKKEKHVRYFKARVLDSHQSEGINGVWKSHSTLTLLAKQNLPTLAII